LGLPGPSPDAISRCRNKWLQREALRRAGVTVPRYSKIESQQQVAPAIRRLSLPVVLKPIFGTGSIGVKLCRTLHEAQTHAAFLLGQVTNQRGIPITPGLLIEEFLDGPEYSVETFGRNLIGVTKKYLSAEPFFVELGHDFPAQLDETLKGIIWSTTIRTLNAVGLSWGPAHTEIRLTKRGPVIIEINPRLAGGQIPTLIRHATGIDLVAETLKASAGIPVSFDPRSTRFASIRFIVPARAGLISEISGLQEANCHPAVVAVELNRESGQSVSRHNDFRDRIGHVITCSQNAFECSSAADWALRQIRIDVRS
jgi:S-sulfo-L-cysteine synthase (3-phospho-L-serine-dependent)